MKHKDKRCNVVLENGELCNRPVHSKQMCSGHYKRFWRGGNMRTPIKELPNEMRQGKPCKVKNCNKPIQAKGRCFACYQRMRRNSELNYDIE